MGDDWPFPATPFSTFFFLLKIIFFVTKIFQLGQEQWEVSAYPTSCMAYYEDHLNWEWRIHLSHMVHGHVPVEFPHASTGTWGLGPGPSCSYAWGENWKWHTMLWMEKAASAAFSAVWTEDVIKGFSHLCFNVHRAFMISSDPALLATLPGEAECLYMAQVFQPKYGCQWKQNMHCVEMCQH